MNKIIFSVLERIFLTFFGGAREGSQSPKKESPT